MCDTAPIIWALRWPESQQASTRGSLFDRDTTRGGLVCPSAGDKGEEVQRWALLLTCRGLLWNRRSSWCRPLASSTPLLCRRLRSLEPWRRFTGHESDRQWGRGAAPGGWKDAGNRKGGRRKGNLKQQKNGNKRRLFGDGRIKLEGVPGAGSLLVLVWYSESRGGARSAAAGPCESSSRLPCVPALLLLLLLPPPPSLLYPLFFFHLRPSGQRLSMSRPQGRTSLVMTSKVKAVRLLAKPAQDTEHSNTTNHTYGLLDNIIIINVIR